MKKLFGIISRSLSSHDKLTVIKDFSQIGYSIINFNYYSDLSRETCSHVSTVTATYENLKKDNYSNGNRYRSYSRYQWCPEKNSAQLDVTNDYFQSRNYNPLDGDKSRKFEQISDAFLQSPLIEAIFVKDIEIAKNLDHVVFNDDLEIGLHQIRYKANFTNVAYSTPVWLHKDVEPIVFIHVVNYSQNLVGGDNIIAKNGSDINRAVRLAPLQTLLLSKNVLHAVTPMSSLDENDAVRDILVVTFKNKKEYSGANLEEEKTLTKTIDSSTVLHSKNTKTNLNSRNFSTMNIASGFFKSSSGSLLGLGKSSHISMAFSAK